MIELLFRVVADVFARDDNFSRVRPDKSHQDSQAHRFAHPAASHDADCHSRRAAKLTMSRTSFDSKDFEAS